MTLLEFIEPIKIYNVGAWYANEYSYTWVLRHALKII